VDDCSYTIYNEIYQKDKKRALNRLQYRQNIIRKLIEQTRQIKNIPTTDRKLRSSVGLQKVNQNNSPSNQQPLVTVNLGSLAKKLSFKEKPTQN